jgi:hypothetical protein
MPNFNCHEYLCLMSTKHLKTIFRHIIT